jgi:hypothetical protein
MNLAVAKAASSHVEFDNVSKITLADGTNQTAAYKPASGKSGFGIDWSGVDNDVDIILKTAATGTTNAAITQKATGSISSTGHAADVTLAVTAGGVTKTATLSAGFTNGISGYNVAQPSTFYPAVAAELNRQFDETSHPFNVVIANDFQRSFTYDIDAFAGGISSPTSLLTGTNRYLDFNFAGVNITANLSATIATTDALVERFLLAIKASAATRTTNVIRTGARLVVTPMLAGTNITDVFYTGAAPALGFNAYSAALSLTRALTASHTIVVKSTLEAKGWRITVENESLTVREANLEADGQFLSGGMSSTSRLLASQVGNNALSNTAVLVAWANTRSSSNGSFVAAVSASITSWL